MIIVNAILYLSSCARYSILSFNQLFIIEILPYWFVPKNIGNYRKNDIFFNFRFTGNMIFPSIAENQENMIFTLSVFTKMLFLCSDVSSNGRRPDVECKNFLSFEALGVLRLANSETNFFCRTRRICCFSTFDINALSRCFAWSWKYFKCFVFSAVANPDSFKALSEATFDSKVVILLFTRSCAGVWHVNGSLTIDESTSLMACGCYWLQFKESKLGIEDELLPVLLLKFTFPFLEKGLVLVLNDISNAKH